MKSQTYTLITGASSGIGKELAVIAAQEGRNVVLVARGKESLTQLARNLTKRFDIFTEVIESDMTEPGAVTAIVKTLDRKMINVDILVNNAGFGDYGPFINTDKTVQLGMIDLNIRALTELTHALLPKMIKKDSGHVLNVASVAGFLPGPNMSVYFASKAYVLSFSEALAQELKTLEFPLPASVPARRRQTSEIPRIPAKLTQLRHPPLRLRKLRFLVGRQ